MKKLIAVLGLIVLALSAFGLATNLVYLGTSANSGNGDNLRFAMSKINTNLDQFDRTWKTESSLENSRMVSTNGALWMPPATFGGVGNNYGGTIQWGAAGVPTWPYQEGSGTQGKGQIGLYHNWGGGTSNSTPVMLFAAPNHRLENGWNTSVKDTSISIGNEDTSGTININYMNSGFWNAGRRLGNSYPLNFQAINFDATWGWSFANPGIMAFAMPGNEYLHPQGGHGFLGEIWFYTIGPIPNGSGEVNTGIYGGLPVMKMHTNGLEVLGNIYSTNRISVGGAANQGLVTAGIDFASGLQPAFLVGADNNKTIRTSGTDKVFNMSLAPLTAGNPSHTIMSDYNNGGYPTLSIGGGLSSLAPHAEIDFYAATGPITTTGIGNLQMSIIDGAVQFYTRVRMSGTVTAGGTTGAQTINKPSGTVNFAAGATTLVVTDNLVTTDSIISCVVMANDATAIIKNVVPASGSFTIRLNAAATAETKVGFIVVNPN